jgi:hypothetical protein
MLRIGLLALCLVVITVTAYAQDDVENLILNPSFEDDTDILTADPAWSSWFSAGNAAVEFSFDDEEAIDGVMSVKAEILQSSATNWHIGFTQTDLRLDSGQEYTLTFWAKAAEERPLGMEVKREPGGMDWQGVTGNDYIITTEWAEYTQSFTPEIDYPEENGLPAQLCFWLAEKEITIWFDFVHIYEDEYIEIEPSGKVRKAVRPAGKLAVTWAGIKQIP